MTDRVNIFISYKKDDVALANAVDGVFGDFGGERVETFVSTKLLPGTLWENWIHDSLAKSHLLVLLFTDPDQDWGWCLFEAGLFLGLGSSDHRQVICIYQPENGPPRPLDSIQGVKANKTDILAMLKKVLQGTELTRTTTPLNMRVSDAALSDAAENIANLFLLRMVRPEPVYPEILLTFAQSELSDTTIVTPDSRALNLFGIADGDWQWGDFVRELHLQESTLVDELSRAIRLMARRRAPGPLSANYQSESGAYYSPAIYKVERLNDRLVTCRVAFVPQSTPIYAGGPGNAGVLFNMLKMGARFRWEIIEAFLSKLRELERDSSTTIYSDLKNAMEVIEREGAALHFDEYENIKDIFSPDRQDSIFSLYNDWKPMREELGQNIEAKDGERVTSVLQKMRRLNQSFMGFASAQYAEALTPKMGKPSRPQTVARRRKPVARAVGNSGPHPVTIRPLQRASEGKGGGTIAKRA